MNTCMNEWMNVEWKKEMIFCCSCCCCVFFYSHNYDSKLFIVTVLCCAEFQLYNAVPLNIEWLEHFIQHDNIDETIITWCNWRKKTCERNTKERKKIHVCVDSVEVYIFCQTNGLKSWWFHVESRRRSLKLKQWSKIAYRFFFHLKEEKNHITHAQEKKTTTNPIKSHVSE